MKPHRMHLRMQWYAMQCMSRIVPGGAALKARTGGLEATHARRPYTYPLSPQSNSLTILIPHLPL